MTPGRHLGLAFLATALIGCGGHEPLPEIYGVQPGQAYSDQDVRFTLFGSGLIPSFRVDPGNDRRIAVMDGFSGRIGKHQTWVPLDDFGWLGPEQITATLTKEDAAKLGSGPCDVEITDPRGRSATQSDAFIALGSDRQPPTVSIDEPSPLDSFWPGATLRAHVTASEDAPGYLSSVRWALRDELANDWGGGTCPLSPGAAFLDCTFSVRLADALTPGTALFAIATDNAGNQSRAIYLVNLGESPRVLEVTPSSGPTQGGTNVAIKISVYTPDSLVFLDDQPLYPDGGVVTPLLPERGAIITGYTPAHRAGLVTVKVISRQKEFPLSEGFTYRDPPPEGTP